jgi:benzodiazapine receptor
MRTKAVIGLFSWLALGLFLAQLAANALWGWLFFAWRLGGLGFLEILLLWVSFAALLNYSLWQLNPELLQG